MEYFHEKVRKVRRRQKIELTEMAEFYLVHLLSDTVGTKDWVQGEPVALLYGRALEAPDAKEQFRLFKEVGDRSLYVSGFFGDSLSRRSVDIDYFISMGGLAYNFVSAMAESKHRSNVHPEIFAELSEKFARLVDLLSEISESAGILSDQDVVRLYERWLKTKSNRLLKILSKKGIIPVGERRASSN